MPDAAGLELIGRLLNERHDDSIVDFEYRLGCATLIVNAKQIGSVLTWLKEDPEQGYNFLASLHGADYLPRQPRFAVHYELLNMARAERIHVKAPLAEPTDGLPQLPSCTEIFPTASFQEREVYDMFGIVFKGHPDLRRILMPDEYEGWPQRRDFPLGGEPVQFTFNEERYATS